MRRADVRREIPDGNNPHGVTKGYKSAVMLGEGTNHEEKTTH